jgi:hypothetical protein
MDDNQSDKSGGTTMPDKHLAKHGSVPRPAETGNGGKEGMELDHRLSHLPGRPREF